MDLKNSTILIVEDNSSCQSLYTEILCDITSHFLYANTGKEALELFNSNEVSLVIMDLLLPGMNGLDISKHIRATTTTIPIVFVTANIQRELVLACCAIPNSRFLSKPITYLKLHKVIEELCS